MCDDNFELISNLDKFPFGSSGFNTEGITSLMNRKCFNQHLLNVDERFSSDLDYLFCSQYIVKSKQILDDAKNITMYGVKGLELQLLKLETPDV
uniref:Uncharacterized protein n=1 Tax=Amphimedon queenslandica TaxID=400682 RepID=A0A1X7VA43_AMPQE